MNVKCTANASKEIYIFFKITKKKDNERVNLVSFQFSIFFVK